MSLPDLLNVPKNDQDWNNFFFQNKDSHDRIRKAIQQQTGSIESFTIVNGGSGYTSLPAIEITGGNGQGASANITITGGVITAFTVASGGVQYVNPIVTISGGGGSGAEITATASPDINLTDYVVYPVDQNQITIFLQNNQSLHSDMNGALGLQSSDLQDTDFKDENEKIAWFYSHYLEHYDAETELGI